MGVLDKFLDIMKLSDDDDYDDDDFFDAMIMMKITMKNRAKKSFFGRNKKDHDFDEDEEYDDYDELPAKTSRSSRSSNKVTPMRQPARRSNVSMEVCVQ